MQFYCNKLFYFKYRLYYKLNTSSEFNISRYFYMQISIINSLGQVVICKYTNKNKYTFKID